MILHATETGEGAGERAGEGASVAILLHGLFGSSSNFTSIQRRLATGRRVLAFDLRNHGRSAHDPAMDYRVMAADVADTMAARSVGSAALVGHSMGGKVAMMLALVRPELVSRLLVADIAPVAYPPRYDAIVAAMRALPLTPTLTRAAAEAALAPAIEDRAMRQFLLSNLRFAGVPSWRIGLDEIAAGLPAIMGWDGAGHYGGPVLALRGERSDYILPEHRAVFRALFPAVRFASLREAGHWLHAEQPDAFTATVEAFLR